MAEALILGAALGAAFDLLFLSVVDATRKVARFSSDLNRLKSTLSSIKAAIDDVESLNKILDRPLHEIEAFTFRLMQGEKLIRRCARVSKINVFMRFYYSRKLSNLEASLLKFFQMSVAALHFRETKRISVVVSNLEGRMDELIEVLKRSEINANSVEFVVGYESGESGSVVEHSVL